MQGLKQFDKLKNHKDYDDIKKSIEYAIGVMSQDDYLIYIRELKKKYNVI